MTAQTLLSRLDKVASRGDGNWMAGCPAHDDRGPSLSVRELENGTVLLHCFAGCSAQAVVESVGLELGDLFPDKPERLEHPRGRPIGRPRISAWDALRSLDRYALTVLIAADDVRAGKALSDEDMATLRAAAGTISRVREVLRDIA